MTARRFRSFTYATIKGIIRSGGKKHDTGAEVGKHIIDGRSPTACICSARKRAAQVIAASLSLATAACTTFDPLDNRGETINRNATDYANNATLLNIVRAKLSEPLTFITITGLDGTDSATGTLGFGGFTLGPHAHTSPHTFLLGADSFSRTGSNTFHVSVVDDPASFAALLAPVSPATIAFSIGQGYPRELIFFLTVDRIHESGADNKVDAVSTSDYFNTPDANDANGVGLFIDKMATLLKEGLVAQIDVTAVPTGRAIPASKLCIDPSLHATFTDSMSQGGLAVNVPATPGSVQHNASTAIQGVSVSDSAAATADVKVTVMLSDTNGSLSAGSGATVTGAGTPSLSVSGTLSQVNAALATLSYSPSVKSGLVFYDEKIDVIVYDARSNFAKNEIALSSPTLAIKVPLAPVPVRQSVVTPAAPKPPPIEINGVTVEDHAAVDAAGQIKVVLTDSSGDLSVTDPDGAKVTAAVAHQLTISGTLVQVNKALMTLTYTPTSRDKGLVYDGMINVVVSDGRRGAVSGEIVLSTNKALCANAAWIEAQSSGGSGGSSSGSGGSSGGSSSGGSGQTSGGVGAMAVAPNGSLWAVLANEKKIVNILPNGTTGGEYPLKSSTEKPPHLTAYPVDDLEGNHFEFYVRSTYGIYDYIGAVLRNNADIANLLKPDEAGYAGIADVLSSDTTQKTDAQAAGDCFAQVEYRGINYCVPAKSSHTKRLFALLHQLQQLNTAPSNAPNTLTVTTVP